VAKKPVMLIILDGWGIRKMEHGNAIALGNTPNYDTWLKTKESAIVDTFGEHVGLTPGQMGNSEVGHMNLGAGRVVFQDISRIDNAIKDGSLAQKEVLANGISKAKSKGKKVHLIGLLGPGGVHSHKHHLYALLDITKAHDVETIIHVITDGRDTPPHSGIEFLQNLEDKMASIDHGRIASVCGRYYEMDRDKRWERTRLAWDVLVNRKGKRAETAQEAIQQSYANDVTDEFIVPTAVGDDEGVRVESGDTLIFYNFRADRMRQIVQAFALKEFEGAAHFDYIEDLEIITFTEYIKGLPVNVLFPVKLPQNTLAEVISRAGLKQYHSAETEKYAHVTFFFNGRLEKPWPGEDRKIIPSPTDIPTYDFKPEMSAYPLTEETLKRLDTHDDDFLLINFANPDMVGHTGSLEAAMKAVAVVDECAGKLVNRVLEKGGVAIVTADHGNCERMINEITGEPHTYHTVGPVNLFVIGEEYYGLFSRGKLADVAPTVLELMGLEKPAEMTGQSLIDHTGA
jgi:2,3-bisphosphoglycerate-independent phosphoglycerate mutase